MSQDEPFWKTTKNEVMMLSQTSPEEMSQEKLAVSMGKSPKEESKEETKGEPGGTGSPSRSKKMLSGSPVDNKSEPDSKEESPDNSHKYNPKVSNISAKNKDEAHTEELPQQNTMEVRLDPSDRIIKEDQSENTQPEQSEEEQEREEPEEETENESDPDFGRDNSDNDKNIHNILVEEIKGDIHPRYESESESSEESLSRFGRKEEAPAEDVKREHVYAADRSEEDAQSSHRGNPASASAGEDCQSNQSFGREDPISHVEVSNQDQDIKDFKAALTLKYESFKRSVTKKYEEIRLEYLRNIDFKIKENERENASAIDFLEQQLEEAINEKDSAIKRASQSRIILANTLREKYNTHYLKRACFQSWKYYYEWKKYKEAKSKFCDNYFK